MNFKYIHELLSLKKNKRKNSHSTGFSKKNSKFFIKKRTSFCLKNKHIQSCKILGNNIMHYYIALLFLVILLSIYIIVGPTFKVKNIDIIKQDDITNMNIAYKAITNYRGDSIFSIEKKEILKSLKSYQNNIRDIKTDIILPNTLKIIIDSYKGVFNTTINNKTFIITENGTLIPKEYSKELKELNIEHSFNKNNFIDYKKILDTEYIYKIKQTSNSLEENILNLKIVKLSYYLVERELHIKTDKNTTIIISLNGNIEEQIEKIAIFNKEMLDINKSAIMYIDLRIKNKIFYCTNENEYQCIQNIKDIYSLE